MRPVCISNCADCGVGTITLGEWYVVHDRLWEQAWIARRKSWHGKVPGLEILCIGCLEQRIGRTLMADDFTDSAVNDPFADAFLERLFDRLIAKQPLINDRSTLDDYLAWRDIELLPEDEREAAWLAWKNSERAAR